MDPISEAVEKKDKDEVRQIKIKFCAAELMFGLVDNPKICLSTSSKVNLRMHIENHLSKLSGYALKVLVVDGTRGDLMGGCSK